MTQSRQNSTNQDRHIRVKFLAGAMSGCFSAIVNHPLINATLYAHAGTLSQNLNFRTLYQGMPGSACCLVPAISIQFGVSAKLNDLYRKKTGNEVTLSVNAVNSLTAGSISALPATFQEHVLTQMKYSKGTRFVDMATAMKNNVGTWRLCTTGLVPTMFRFSIGNVCVMTLSPKFKNIAVQNGVNDSTANILSCFSAGSIASVVTQPADRVKFTQQSATPSRLSATEAFIHIYRTGGIANFFTASAPRLLHVTTAVTVASLVNLQLEEYNSKRSLR